MQAQARYEFIKLQSIIWIEGEYIVEVECRDYNDYCALPAAISYDRMVMGKTGWNSDKCKACYKSKTGLLAQKL